MKKAVLFFSIGFFLFFVLFYAGLSYAEVNGTMENMTTTNIYGLTIPVYCNATDECSPYTCYIDYDGVSDEGFSGWCHDSTNSCVHDGSWYGHGTDICKNDTAYYSCNHGSWGTHFCASDEHCEDGQCVDDETQTNDENQDTNSNQYSIRIKSGISDFEIEQGATTLKSLIVENNGNENLFNVRVSLSLDDDWYSVTPSEFSELVGEKAFSISFEIPEDAEIKEHNVEAVVHASPMNLEQTDSFTIKVLPSDETINSVILPAYENYTNTLENLKQRASLSGNAELNNTIAQLEEKLNEMSSAIDSKDYYAAYHLIDDIESLLKDIDTGFEERITGSAVSSPLPIYTAIIVIVVIAAAVIVVKKGYHKTIIEKIKNRKKDGEDGFAYRYKR